VIKATFNNYFSYIVAVSFIGGENRSTRRRLSTCRKSLTTFIEYSSQLKKKSNIE